MRPSGEAIGYSDIGEGVYEVDTRLPASIPLGGAALRLASNKAMSARKVSRLKVFVSAGLVLLLAAAAAIFFFDETEFSWAKISWRQRFDQELQAKGEAKLGDLVRFKWEKIYFIDPYDYLRPEQAADLFPRTNALDPFWWYQDRNYWTIAYQRPGRAPFLVRIPMREWYLRGLTNYLTRDPDAKFRRVPLGSIESTYCTSRYDRSRCLALDDVNSKIPTVPQ